MTQLLVAGGLGQVFRNSTHTAAYLKLFARQQEEERLRRERRDELRDDAADVADFAMVAISSAELAEFRVELDRYDAATVEALQINEIELIKARDNLDGILLKAHVLPDGRRVFKDEQGTRVFDEYGRELSAEVIHADEIDDRRPRWETFDAARSRVEALESERTEILGYQETLDHARERLDAGDMTRKEFDELSEKLKDDMPDAVRAHVPGMEASRKPDASADNKPLAGQLDVTDEMLPTSSLSSRISTPVIGG